MRLPKAHQSAALSTHDALVAVGNGGEDIAVEGSSCSRLHAGNDRSKDHTNVNVSSTNDNIRVEVYNKAANYATDISVSGTASAMPGGNVKYNFNVANNSTSAMPE